MITINSDIVIQKQILIKLPIKLILYETKIQFRLFID